MAIRTPFSRSSETDTISVSPEVAAGYTPSEVIEELTPPSVAERAIDRTAERFPFIRRLRSPKDVIVGGYKKIKDSAIEVMIDDLPDDIDKLQSKLDEINDDIQLIRENAMSHDPDIKHEVHMKSTFDYGPKKKKEAEEKTAKIKKEAEVVELHNLTDDDRHAIKVEKIRRARRNLPELSDEKKKRIIAKDRVENGRGENSRLENEMEAIEDNEKRIDTSKLTDSDRVALEAERSRRSRLGLPEMTEEDKKFTIALDRLRNGRLTVVSEINRPKDIQRKPQSRTAFMAIRHDTDEAIEAYNGIRPLMRTLKLTYPMIDKATWDENGNLIISRNDKGEPVSDFVDFINNSSRSHWEKVVARKTYKQLCQLAEENRHILSHIRRTWSEEGYDGGENEYTRRLIAARNKLEIRLANLIEEQLDTTEKSNEEDALSSEIERAREQVDAARAEAEAEAATEESEIPVVRLEDLGETERADVEYALENYLSYGDLHDPSIGRADEYRDTAVTYAREFVRLNKSDHGELFEASDDIRFKFADLRDLLPSSISDLSAFSRSVSWSLWDIAKQEALKDKEYPSTLDEGINYSGSVIKTPESSDEELAQADLMRNVIAWRHFGWELHMKALNGESLYELDAMLDEETRALLHKVGENEGGQLTSSEYADLGRRIEAALRSERE